MRRNILLCTLFQTIVSGAVFGFTAAFVQAEVVPGSCDLYIPVRMRKPSSKRMFQKV